jgi:hypothetical protein
MLQLAQRLMFQKAHLLLGGGVGFLVHGTMSDNDRRSRASWDAARSGSQGEYSMPRTGLSML